MRTGALCGQCTRAGRCVNPPAPGLALYVPCDCGGDPACPECRGNSKGACIEQCPFDLLTSDVTEFFQMMDYADAGTMPVLAGSRDQANIFMEAVAFTRARLAEGRKDREAQDG
jgi:hypothetical protein